MILQMARSSNQTQSLTGWLDHFDQGDLHVTAELSARSRLPAHTPLTADPTRQHLLLLILAGQGVYICRGEQLELAPGTALWIQPGVSYTCNWQTQTELLHVAFSLRARQQAVRVGPHWLYSAEAWSLREKLEQILDELALPMPQSPRRIHWLLGLAVTDIMRQHSRYQRADGLSASQRSRLAQFVAWRGVQSTYVADLAELLGLSEDYFARRFRQTFGQSPQTWLMRQRMLAAGRLMQDTGISATQVARAAGYTDLSQFSRQFRRTLGVPPSRYRRG